MKKEILDLRVRNKELEEHLERLEGRVGSAGKITEDISPRALPPKKEIDKGKGGMRRWNRFVKFGRRVGFHSFHLTW